MKIQIKDRPVLKKMDDGLILCRSLADDAEGLAEFNSHIHSDDGFDQPDQRVATWTRDLVGRPHPTFKADDCTLVVEESTGKIISSMNLISQTWSYEGISFKVGRPELVGTLPDYRNRGLVRLQFAEVHQWSEDRGEYVQAITGIPFYYKLFGYEMGLELSGGRTGYEAQLPKLKDGENEPFHIRAAEETDIPFMMDVYDHACKRQLIHCVRSEANWRYDLSGQSKKNIVRLEYRIIENPETKEKLGYLVHPWFDWDTGLIAQFYELKLGVSWLETSPTVARYLWQTGESYATRDGKPEKRTTYSFWFGSSHPSYDVFKEKLPRLRDPYAWYVRVPNLPRFLKHITPALEKHIASSAIVGYTGTVKISFYHSGLRFTFDKGIFQSVETWQPVPGDTGSAAFPDLSFLQLLFGYRTIEELEQSYADCLYENDEVRVLLNTLFPKKPSSLMMVG